MAKVPTFPVFSQLYMISLHFAGLHGSVCKYLIKSYILYHYKSSCWFLPNRSFLLFSTWVICVSAVYVSVCVHAQRGHITAGVIIEYTFWCFKYAALASHVKQVVLKIILHVVLKVELIVLAALGNELLRYKNLGKIFLSEHQRSPFLGTQREFSLSFSYR